MPRFFFASLSVFAAVLLAAASPASAQICPPAAPVKVNVTFEHKQNPVEKNVTSRQLTAHMREQDASAGGEGNIFATEAHWMVGGLNSSRYRISYKMPYMRRDGKDGMSCIMPQSFDYHIVYENTIYIAEDFRQMGCRYSATMAHEKRHEKADLRIFEEFSIDVRKTLEKAVAGMRPVGPLPAAAVEAAFEKKAAETAAQVQPLIDRMLQTRKRRHAEIDSYENYMRDTALCPEQFPRFEEAGD